MTEPTVSSALAEAARRWPDRIALRCVRLGQRVSFAELDALAGAVVDALRDRGIGPGDRVAVMFRNDLEFPVCWLGALRAGAAMVPLNVRLTGPELAALLAEAAPALVLAAEEFAPLLAGVAPAGTDPLLLPADGSDLAAALAGLRVPGSRAVEAAAGPVPETLANIQFTSGSTGRSKGCLLSHHYWLTLAEAVRTHGPRLREDDVLLTAQPFYYMDPQWNLVAALLTGAELVVLERFSSATFWASVREYRVTFFYCLGVMPAMLLRTPVAPGERETRVRYIGCSAIPEGRHAELERRFGAPWHELYGSTETGVDILVEPADHDLALADGLLGRPLPNREIRVVDEEDLPVPRGVLGRLLVRGVAMSDGYLDGSSATVGNGWYVTGDLAVRRPDGMVRFAGRVKDIIRRSGENISAAQVEEAIQAQPGVRLCACLPVADEVRGEEIKAYLVCGDGPVSPAELTSHVRERLAAFKVPRYWEFRDRLPLTPSEKIAKAELRGEPDAALRRCYDAVAGVWLDRVRPRP